MSAIGHLPENIAYFARALREAGLPVGPGAVLDAIAAVESAAIGAREDFYWTLHAVFVKKRDQHVVFDQAFNIFWQRRTLMERMIALLSPQAIEAEQKKKKQSAGAARVNEAFYKQPQSSAEVKEEQIEIDARFTMNDVELLKEKDFAQMSAAEISAAKREMQRLRLPDDSRITRRLAPGKGRTIDLSATMRTAMRNAGDIIDIRFKVPQEKHPPIVALCDISGSMAEYSRLFLHFLHAVSEEGRKLHAFVFATRLTNITRALRSKDPDEALEGCTKLVKDWDGGTRISHCLERFNKDWSRRVTGQGAIVLLITDGLERQVDDALAHELDRLHRSCRKLVWLNPLLRFDGFEARATGIRAMLPHVDEFRTIHNLRSMRDLIDALSKESSAATDPKTWLKRAA